MFVDKIGAWIGISVETSEKEWEHDQGIKETYQSGR